MTRSRSTDPHGEIEALHARWATVPGAQRVEHAATHDAHLVPEIGHSPCERGGVGWGNLKSEHSFQLS